MDLLDLIKQFQTHFDLGHPYTQMTAAGTSYGPAQTRITQTPVTYTTDMTDPINRGEFSSDTNQIKINPLLADDIGNVTRHESVHALMNYLTPEHMSQIVGDVPGYYHIADAINKARLSANSGSPWSEIPAYMAAAPYSQIKGVTDAQRADYLKGLKQQLDAVHPQLGATFQRLINSSGPSNSSSPNNNTGQ